MPTRQSRGYVHHTCGMQTEVSGFDFYRISNPFFFISGATQCARCGVVDLQSVCWTDTNESLRDYRARQRGKRSWVWIGWLLFLLGGAIAGAIILPRFAHANIGPEARIAIGIGLGCLVGVVLGYVGVPMIYHASIGKDPRDLQ